MDKYLYNPSITKLVTIYMNVKPDAMCELKLKQVQYESEAWKRLLCFMIDENIHLKTRLCEVLKDQSGNSFLDELEVFLNGFIKKDELINLLRNDLAELDELLKREALINEKSGREIFEKINKFRNCIVITEKRFSELKIGFFNYLSTNL